MKTLRCFFSLVFFLFSAGVAAQQIESCSIPPLIKSYMFEHDGRLSSMGADQLVDSINCLDDRLGRLEMRVENLHVDWLQEETGSTQTRSIDNEDKIKQLEMRLSALEITLQRAEETIQRLQLESSFQMPRHPARPAVSKPKTQANKPKPAVDSQQ